MANPLALAREPVQSSSLRAWCEEQNAKPLFRRMERWYYVTKSDGAETITSLTGCDANNVRRLIEGALPDFEGWPASRMNGYRRWLQSCAEAGFVQ